MTYFSLLNDMPADHNKEKLGGKARGQHGDEDIIRKLTDDLEGKLVM